MDGAIAAIDEDAVRARPPTTCDLRRRALAELDEATLRAQLAPGAVRLALSNNYLPAFAIGAPAFLSLTAIDLTCNELHGMPALGGAPQCAQLWLGHNRIASMAPPAPLPALRELDLQHNQLVALLPLPLSPCLERLGCSCNRIARIEEGACYPRLQQLGLFGNALANLDPLEALLARSPALRRLAAGASPCTPAGLPDVARSAEQRAWRSRLLRAQPRLRWLDGELVGGSERRAAPCMVE